jgi:hypothetical protein
MNMMRKILPFIIVMVLISNACVMNKTVVENQLNGVQLVSLHPEFKAIIYKTKGDFSNNIPVIMNSERTRIVWYPTKEDLKYDGKITRPVVLKKGYLLDNNRINENVAYLSFTYEQYFNFKQMPSDSLMMKYLLEKYPLTEMYDCGVRNEYRDLIAEINVLIDRDLKNCKKIQLK